MLSIFMMIVLVGAVFGGIIYFGLKARDKMLVEDHALSATRLPQYAQRRREQDLIYAVGTDFSFSSTGFIVRNDRDAEIARIIFHTGQSSPCVTIEMPDSSLPIMSRMEMNQCWCLEDGNGATLCTARRYLTKSVFTRPDQPDIILERPLKRSWHQNYDIAQHSRIIGSLSGLYSNMRRGRVLLLPSDIPLAIKLFIMTAV